MTFARRVTLFLFASIIAAVPFLASFQSASAVTNPWTTRKQAIWFEAQKRGNVECKDQWTPESQQFRDNWTCIVTDNYSDNFYIFVTLKYRVSGSDPWTTVNWGSSTRFQDSAKRTGSGTVATCFYAVPGYSSARSMQVQIEYGLRSGTKLKQVTYRTWTNAVQR